MTEVLIGMPISFNFCQNASDIGLFLDNLFLSISHDFVFLYLRFDEFDFFLNRFTKLFQKCHMIVIPFIFSLVKFFDVLVYMLFI